MSAEGIALLEKNLDILTKKHFDSEEEFKKAIEEFELACAGANNLGCIFDGRVEEPLTDQRDGVEVKIYPISIDVYSLRPHNEYLTTIKGMAYVRRAESILEIDLDPEDLKFLGL